MDMNEQRTAKAAELRDEVMHNHDRAEALETLAKSITTAAIPVERWRPYWATVANECRRQAINARAHARECADRAATVEMAVTARNGWQPAPTSATGNVEAVADD